MPSKDLKLHHIGQKMDWKKIAELADTPPSPIAEYFCGKNKLCNWGYPSPLQRNSAA